jgi:hypothetical protein
MKKEIKYSISIFFLLVSISDLYALQTQKVPENDKIETLILFGGIIFLVGVLVGAFLIYLYSQQSIYKILSNERYKYIDDLRNSHERFLFTYIGLFSILKKSKDDYKSKTSQNSNNGFQKSNNSFQKSDNSFQLEKLNNEIEELKIQKQKLLEENILLGGLIDKNKYQSIEPQSTKTEIEQKSSDEVQLSNVKFFTIPENDGSFKISSGKNNRETDCFYKIEVDKNGQKGKLHFISGDYDSRALDNIDFYLNPVCEIENITKRIHARKIQMKESGNVIMSSDSWKIDINHKVKIKFI